VSHIYELVGGQSLLHSNIKSVKTYPQLALIK